MTTKWAPILTRLMRKRKKTWSSATIRCKCRPQNNQGIIWTWPSQKIKGCALRVCQKISWGLRHHMGSRISTPTSTGDTPGSTGSGTISHSRVHVWISSRHTKRTWTHSSSSPEIRWRTQSSWATAMKEASAENLRQQRQPQMNNGPQCKILLKMHHD